MDRLTRVTCIQPIKVLVLAAESHGNSGLATALTEARYSVAVMPCIPESFLFTADFSPDLVLIEAHRVEDIPETCSKLHFLDVVPVLMFSQQTRSVKLIRSGDSAPGLIEDLVSVIKTTF